MIEKLI